VLSDIFLRKGGVACLTGKNIIWLNMQQIRKARLKNNVEKFGKIRTEKRQEVQITATKQEHINKNSIPFLWALARSKYSITVLHSVYKTTV
jgi:transcription termination factor Rho